MIDWIVNPQQISKIDIIPNMYSDSSVIMLEISNR